MGYTELDSILGQPVPEYVINQFYIRSDKTLDTRDDNALVYMANKSGWIRVVSSVNITGSYADSIKRITKLPSDEEKLAKSFVLFGGTSAYTGKMDVTQISPDRNSDPLDDFKNTTAPRYEPKPYFDVNNIDPTYGLRPIAGITAAKITTQGKLGSILQADIDFKVNTKQQLDVVDILYFKLGYTMFIEWGNTFFYKQKNNPTNQLEPYDVLQKSEDYAVDPFKADMDEAKLRVEIAKAIRQTDGNYDAMVGLVTNFSFTSNTEGGYDCKLKVIGPGMLAESMRTNTIASLPDTFKDAIGKIANIITNINKNQAEAIARREYEEKVALITAQTSAAKNDPSNRDNYPGCIRDRIYAGEFQIVTVNNETYAKPSAATSELKDYVFFINSTFRKGTTITTFECNGSNIVDKSSGKPINTPDPGPLKFDQFVADVKKDTKRYSTLNDPKYPGSTDNIYVEDRNQKNDQEKYYYILQKEKTVLRLKEKTFPGALLRPNNVKAAFNWNLPQIRSILGLGSVNTDLNTILGPNNISTSANVNTGVTAIQGGSPDKLNVDGGAGKTIVLETKDANGYITYFDVDYAANDTLRTGTFGNFPTGEDDGFYTIEYASGAVRKSIGTRKIYIRYSTKFSKTSGVTYDPAFKTGNVETDGPGKEGETRQKIVDAIVQVLSGNWLLSLLQIQVNSEYGAIFEGLIPVDNLPGTIGPIVQTGRANIPKKTVYVKQDVRIGIGISDFDLVTKWQITDAYISPNPSTNVAPPVPSQGAQIPAYVPPDYTKVKVDDLQNSEAAMYKSQMEGILRTIQLLTIERFISGNGEISKVDSIKWGDPKGKDKQSLYNIFADGAFGKGNLQQIIEKPDEIINKAITDNAYYAASNFGKKDRFLTNALFGFHRNLMKDDGVNDPTVLEAIRQDKEYAINFAEILQSFVIPYYQSKNLVEGGDIHYPTYVTMGFFFMILNHCGFLYDTTEPDLNIPLFYLDFNQGSNIILSSDFMLSANPYKFVVPFKGELSSYKKLFDPKILQGDKIIAVNKESNATDLWTTDAVSKTLPPFKFQTTNNSALPNYRGKLMNVLVSIDYLLDTIRSHATKDETNSVYFRSLMDEILSDLSKSLGNFNVLRLAYDDYSNCFCVVDDQAIPGNNVMNAVDNVNILNTVPYEIPVFGKQSIARSFTIQTDNSTKLSNMLAISANSDVKNQTTAGTDGTGVGNSSLYAINRYRPVTTAVNDNAKAKLNTGSLELQRKALAASRFNESVKGYYLGGSRSEEGVEQAINYYIEAVAKARNTEKDPEIRATTLLPLSVNFSTDGISGMGIYHAFTIPEEMLPYSYTIAAGGFGQNATRRVGFIVTGLDHTIQNNSWTTDVKANMYYVKNIAGYQNKPSKLVDGTWKGVPKPTNNSQESNLGVPGFVPTGDLYQTGNVLADNLSRARGDLEKMWLLFKAEGYSQAAAAGALGTMYRESGLNPYVWIIGATERGSGKTTVEAGSGKGQKTDQQTAAVKTGMFTTPTYNGKRVTAYGIPQWVGKRLDNYVNFVNSRGGASADNLETQMLFILKEASSRPNLVSKLKSVPNDATGAELAALYWIDYYEFSVPYITDSQKRAERRKSGLGAWNIIKDFK